LYGVKDVSGNKIDLFAKGYNFGPGPEGYPYSAHVIYTFYTQSYLVLRSDRPLLPIRKGAISIATYIYFPATDRNSPGSFVADFRQRRHYYTGGIVGVIMFNVHPLSMGFYVSELTRCSAVLEGSVVKHGKWIFVTGSYDHASGKVRVSVDGVFVRGARCNKPSWRGVSEFFIANCPYRGLTPKQVNRKHRYACYQVFDRYLTRRELLEQQYACLGRGELIFETVQLIDEQAP
jgi:hypothetical protein